VDRSARRRWANQSQQSVLELLRKLAVFPLDVAQNNAKSHE
jgi:hypothetical protein